ncbi:HIT zinc finger protein [Toxoplasma gondii TgCatPRC2]|uniref:HIT zinc finger protein n=1 Tax=Toxoplasma gondii TgCatPRC2 TaxID=1130821 RepID=A0A151H007_TOXGO|nr:HIT zinc finger protein [Toxoplasma gondii TgCatPRC2]
MADGASAQTVESPPATESPAASAVYAGPSERLCVVCQSKEGIYRCSRCLRRTCSLACYKAHEKRPGQHREVFRSSSSSASASSSASSSLSSSSSGASAEGGCPLLRSRVDYVALRDFDEKFLFRDFRLVEEAARVVEAAARHWRREADECAHRNRKRRSVHPQHLRALCVSRGIRFLFCPPNFSRRKVNTTRVVQRRSATPKPGQQGQSRHAESTAPQAEKREQERISRTAKSEEGRDPSAEKEAERTAVAGTAEAASHARARGDLDEKGQDDGEKGEQGEEGEEGEEDDAGEDGHEAPVLRAGDSSESKAVVNSGSDSSESKQASPSGRVTKPSTAPAGGKKEESSAIEWRVVFHFRELHVHRVLPAVHEDLPIYQVLAELLDAEGERGMSRDTEGAAEGETESEDDRDGSAASGEKRKKGDSRQEAVAGQKKPRTEKEVQRHTETTASCPSLAKHLARRKELVLLLPSVGLSCRRSCSPSSVWPSSPSLPSSSVIIPARKCDRGWTLREALSGTVVVEFPEFFVALPEELSSFDCVQPTAVPPPLASPGEPRGIVAAGFGAPASRRSPAAFDASSADAFVPNSLAGAAGAQPGESEDAENEGNAGNEGNAEDEDGAEDEEDEGDEEGSGDEELLAQIESLFPSAFGKSLKGHGPEPGFSDFSSAASTLEDASPVSTNAAGGGGGRDRGRRGGRSRGPHSGPKFGRPFGAAHAPASSFPQAALSPHQAVNAPPHPGARPPSSGVQTPEPAGAGAASADGQGSFPGAHAGCGSLGEDGRTFGYHRGGGRGRGRGFWRGGRERRGGRSFRRGQGVKNH